MDQSLTSQFILFHRRALPALGNNIKCGNSLIGSDFYRNRQLSFMDEEERLRINVFDWEKEFPKIFTGPNPGFDAVIGNPPYIRIQKGLSLLSSKGRLGFILPHKFFNAQYGEPLRGLISKGKHLAEVIHFGDKQVFVGATTYTCLMFLEKAGAENCKYVKVDTLDAWRAKQDRNGNLPDSPNRIAAESNIPATAIGPTVWNFTVGQGTALFDRLRQMSFKLGNLAELFVGLQTDADDIFILEEIRGHEKAALQRQIDATDRQIDQLVYELYGLTDEEIRIVEESTAAKR